MSLMDRLLKKTKDYIGFRELLFRLSSLNNEPLYAVVTHLLHYDFGGMTFYNIDADYKITRSASYEFANIIGFLEEIQGSLSLTDEDWVWTHPTSLDELSEYSRRAITTTVSKTMHCFFKKSDLLSFEPLNGLLHFESEEIENPIDKIIEENDRKYISVTKYVNDLGKGKSIGSGKPLKITVKYILENIPLNEVNLYKLKGTNYLLVSQASDFKYKNATDILQSVYDILDDEQTGTVSSDREPFEGFYFNYSQVRDLTSIAFKTVAKKQMIHLDKQPSTNSPKSLDNSSVINNLGENQRLLTTYALFTPEDLTCLLIDENPACISHNDNYLRHHHMVSNAIDAKLLTLNDEGKILAGQAKTWLASHGFFYKGFNDVTLTYADQLAEVEEEAIAANVKILNLTAKLEDRELDSIIHNHTAHKFLLSDARATIDQLSKENTELRASKKIEANQQKQDDEVSDQTVVKLKKMTADYEELRSKYESINTQNQELVEKLDLASKKIKELNEPDNDNDNEQLSDNTAKDYQVTIGILLELLQTSRGFDKEGKANRAPFLTQNDIITAITDQMIPNQGKTKIGTRFANSNAALAGAKKKREDRLDLADKINRKAASSN